MLAFTSTPQLAMLAAFCTLVAVTILAASAIAAGVVKSEGLNLVLSGDHGNNSGGGKRQMFEKDDKRNKPLGVLGTIQLTSLVDGSTTSLVLNGHTSTLDESHTSGTPIFMARSTQRQVPFVLDNSVVEVTFRLAEAPYMTPRFVTADVDPAHTGGPLTVEPCSDFNDAKAHKTQVFRYEKNTGSILVNWANVKVSFVSLVPGVLKTKDDKYSSSPDVMTANTATASRRIAIFDEEWVPSTTIRRQDDLGSRP